MFSIHIKQAVPRFPEFRFREPVEWKIKEGESWAVIGPNGAGKTTLMDILQRKIVLKEGGVAVNSDQPIEFYQTVKSVSFRDIYSLVDCRNMYYQQRWNSADAGETPEVRLLLKEFSRDRIEKYTEIFGIGHLLEKKIIALSSGELRKFLITRILMTQPRLLILDNPFIGLDADSRLSLNRMLAVMQEWHGLQVILVVSDPADIPGWIDQVLPLYDRCCLPALKREDFVKNRDLQNYLFAEWGKKEISLPGGLPRRTVPEPLVRMEKIRVRYGNKVILDEVDWEIRKGEKWALLGKNGSGKSTLLSLICADNPQAYANKLTLFGRLRGTGESIWDIKKKIGYLTPDMHTYYLEDVPCLEVVASGFFDVAGLYRKCTEEQKRKAMEWLTAFHIAGLAERSFVKISYGEQRLVLLARAFVKDPPLLILDEPLHGLDAGKKYLARMIIEAFCRQKEKSLIFVTHYKQELPPCITRYKTLDI